MNIKIITVGSSLLIAEEIRDIARALLSACIPVIPRRTEEITDAQAADLYLCARTQYEYLAHIIPKKRLFLMELQPDSTFFFAISRIPTGTDVYIFNNYSAYPQALVAYCHTLGIKQVNYIPLAFEEMPPKELMNALSRATYIIGVDRFVHLLQNPPYHAFLRADVQIIAGKRTASLRSAFAVLRCLGSIMQRDLYTRWQAKNHTLMQLQNIAIDVDDAIDILRAGAIRSVVSQAAIPELNRTSIAHTQRNILPDKLRAYIIERLELLTFLQRKIETLNHFN